MNSINKEEFYNQDHITIEDYNKNISGLLPDLKNIALKCGMVNGVSDYSYIIENEHTILIYSVFPKRTCTYGVEVIFTDDKHRNKGSAKQLLKSLDFKASLYFDTYEDSLIHLVKELGGFEEPQFENKKSTELILNIPIVN